MANAAMQADRRQLLIAGTAVVARGAFPTPALAQKRLAPEAYYKGKTVRMLVGSPPGGGYDLYARMILPYLAAKLDATVLIENRDGNGGLLALNYLMSRPADGLHIMHASAEAAMLSQLLQRDGVVWDVAKLAWLARTSYAPKVWFVGKDTRYGAVSDARTAPKLTWAATGPADNISDVAAVISYALDLKSKIVVGYRGAGDMSLSVIRNETDAGVLSADSALNLIASKQVKPLAVLSDKRWPGLPDAPILDEVADIAPDKRWLVTLRQQIGEAQRAMVVAPGTSSDYVAFLRQAFAEVLADPALVQEGARTNRAIDCMSGETLQNVIADLMRAAEPRLTTVRSVMLDTYF